MNVIPSISRFRLKDIHSLYLLMTVSQNIKDLILLLSAQL